MKWSRSGHDSVHFFKKVGSWQVECCEISCRWNKTQQNSPLAPTSCFKMQLGVLNCMDQLKKPMMLCVEVTERHEHYQQDEMWRCCCFPMGCTFLPGRKTCLALKRELSAINHFLWRCACFVVLNSRCHRLASSILIIIFNCRRSLCPVRIFN